MTLLFWYCALRNFRRSDNHSKDDENDDGKDNSENENDNNDGGYGDNDDHDDNGDGRVDDDNSVHVNINF